jgi:3-oxoacyl-[acyl-carrier-protein] synthase-3
MLFGDAGTMTAVESSDDAGSLATFILGTDGKGANNLIIPSGGFRTNWMQDDDRLASRNRACLYMDGGQIFNFTLVSIPSLVSELMQKSTFKNEDFSAFLFHQANLFMLKHLIKKAKLPSERVPTNIDRFGNTSSASIPLLICSNLAESVTQATQTFAMFGFGVGYSWAAAAVKMGPCRTVGLVSL